MSERIVPMIPTASIFQIWEKVGDRLRIKELYCKVRLQGQSTVEQVTPWMKKTVIEKSHRAIIKYKQRLHGGWPLGLICRKLEVEGYLECIATKLVAFDGDTHYIFSNERAPRQLSGTVIRLRKKFLLRRGLNEMPQYLFPRVLRLTAAYPKAIESSKHHIDESQLFTEKNFTHMCRTFGNLFCKVFEHMENRLVWRRRITGVETTVWWE